MGRFCYSWVGILCAYGPVFPRRHLHRSPRLTPRALRASGAPRAPPAPAPRLSCSRLALPPPASSFTPFRPLHNFKDKSSQRLLGYGAPSQIGQHARANVWTGFSKNPQMSSAPLILPSRMLSWQFRRAAWSLGCPGILGGERSFMSSHCLLRHV